MFYTDSSRSVQQLDPFWTLVVVMFCFRHVSDKNIMDTKAPPTLRFAPLLWVVMVSSDLPSMLVLVSLPPDLKTRQHRQSSAGFTEPDVSLLSSLVVFVPYW